MGRCYLLSFPQGCFGVSYSKGSTEAPFLGVWGGGTAPIMVTSLSEEPSRETFRMRPLCSQTLNTQQQRIVGNVMSLRVPCSHWLPESADWSKWNQSYRP